MDGRRNIPMLCADIEYQILGISNLPSLMIGVGRFRHLPDIISNAFLARYRLDTEWEQVKLLR